MSWYYNNEELKEIPEGYIGFVYEITNNITNEKYIGKKHFQFRKTRQVKGKKKKSLVESDWMTYYGSSDRFNESVAEHGQENFTRKILRLCKTKGEMSYFETKEIFERDAILRDEYANTWVSCKIRKDHLKNVVPNTNT